LTPAVPMSKPKKKTKGKSKSTSRITDHAASKTQPEHEYVLFSLLKVVGRFCIANCERKTKIAFVNRLRMITQRTWGEVQHTDKNKTGSESIPVSQIKKSVPQEFRTEEKALSFRLGKKERMLGFRQNNVFYPVWFSDKHDLY